ncbi:YitT family protein [Christensenella intestinihominis]|uniref:YitT family protein n=1 Tax=Christensenella intestinihominis TaxID=1851429 RepID=UPI00083475E7|nr:YitT family protein [Christensenella intestinihominis]
MISKENDRIANEILCRLRRGVAALKSRGVYTGREGEMLVCAVHRPEVSKLYHLIYKINPDAFIIVGDTGQIRGSGFIPNTDPAGKIFVCPLKKKKHENTLALPVRKAEMPDRRGTVKARGKFEMERILRYNLNCNGN